MNLVVLHGRLGKDPEVRSTNSGTSVANFSLATEESYKTKSGEWEKRTEWHNVVVWGRTAEAVGEHLSKGSKVLIVGHLQTRKYESHGETKYTTEVVADTVEFGDSKRTDESDSRPATKQSNQPRTASNRPAPQQEIDDEDIPF